MSLTGITTPRKPADIQSQIDALNTELEESKKFHSMTLVWEERMTDFKSPDSIGFFDIYKARIILDWLNKGREMRIEHEALGNYKVIMNQQRNRILVYNADGTELKTRAYVNDEDGSCKYLPESRINEDTILSFIIWHAGKWYIL